MELGVGLSNTSSTKRNPENGLFISYPASYDLERHREVYERVCIGLNDLHIAAAEEKVYDHVRWNSYLECCNFCKQLIRFSFSYDQSIYPSLPFSPSPLLPAYPVPKTLDLSAPAVMFPPATGLEIILAPKHAQSSFSSGRIRKKNERRLTSTDMEGSTVEMIQVRVTYTTNQSPSRQKEKESEEKLTDITHSKIRSSSTLHTQLKRKEPPIKSFTPLKIIIRRYVDLGFRICRVGSEVRTE